MVLWAGTGVGARATTRASGPARARGRCLGTLEPVVSPVRACSCGTGKRAGHQRAVSPVRAFGERYGKASERGVPEIAILAGTGFLASGKVCKEAKASLVVQPYGSASSPSLAASCAISPVWARSCGTGKRAGIPRLKKCFTLFGCAKPGAIAGETLYIYR